MTQIEKAKTFHGLHVKGDPLMLYNIWDAGTAKAVVEAGAKALATGSWSVAEAQGYGDGEAIPLDHVCHNIERILSVSELPLTVDFEGGYARAPEDVAAHVARLMEMGVIGINVEDQIVGGEGLYTFEDQAARIAAIRAEAEARNLPFFINARTDLFLSSSQEAHPGYIEDAIARAQAYKAAGADGLFVPGLRDHALIKRIVESVDLPVNVMKMGDIGSIKDLAALGVARISYGPVPYIEAMARITQAVKAELNA